MSATDADARGRVRVAVWDAPVRLAHWTLAALFALLWWSGKAGRAQLHLAAGLAITALVLFRLIWGVAGSDTARFAGFVRGPSAVARYARDLVTGRVREVVVGHNPMGGWSVTAMLALLAAVIGAGLFAEDTDGVASGPLAARASYDFTSAAASWHGRLFDVLLALTALHVVAIAFYAVVKRDDLVSPMVRGSRLAPVGTEPLRSAGWLRAGLAAMAAVALTAWIAAGLKPL